MMKKQLLTNEKPTIKEGNYLLNYKEEHCIEPDGGKTLKQGDYI